MILRPLSLLFMMSMLSWCAAMELSAAPEQWTWNHKKWQQPPEFTVLSVAGPEPGMAAMRLNATTPDWDHCLTRILVSERDIARIRLRGWHRAEGVKPGKEPWMEGRVQVHYLDAALGHRDPWPASNGAQGTTGWASFSQELTPPSGTRAVEVRVELTMCTGSASFAGLELDADDAAGSALTLVPPREREVTDTTTWWPFVPGTPGSSAPLVADWTTRLDRPAGRHGFVSVQDGHFIAADGTRMRFWGTSLGPSDFLNGPAKSEQLADRLAASGITLVRLHHLDAGFSPQNLFVPGGTRQLDPQALAALEHFTARLRAHGISIWCDLLVTRRFTAADGVPDAAGIPLGAKIVGIFDDRLITLQQEYARQLLTHVNPETGLAWVDDPALVMIGVANENSVFLNGPISSWDAVPESYRIAIDARWRAERTRRSLPLLNDRLDVAWRHGDADAIAFLAEVQRSYYERMRTFLRQELKVHAALTGNNFDVGVEADRAATATLDFIDHHAYWDHPQGGWAATDVFSNQAQIPQLGQNRETIPGSTAVHRVAGKPLTLSEWGTAFPNSHATESPLLVTAFAGYHDWDAAMAFVQSAPDWRDHITGPFDVGSAPNVMIPLIAYALAFQRGDIAPGPELRFPVGQVEQLPPSALFAGRLVGVPDAPLPAVGPLHSPDGRLALDHGVFTVSSPRTQGAEGLLGGRTVTLTDVEFTAQTPECHLLALSLDDAALASSRHVLLVATARAENSGQVWRGYGKGLLEIGHGPILVEPVHATLALRGAAGTPTAWVLDGYGRRTAQTLPCQRIGERIRVEFGAVPALWAELVIAP